MQDHATSRPTAAKVAAGVVAGVVFGFALGVAVSWPPTEGSRSANDALALMCTALDDLDGQFVQSMEQGEFASSSVEDRRMVASLMAAISYAEVAAGNGDDDLLETAQDLQQALQRVQGEVARAHVEELQGYC